MCRFNLKSEKKSIFLILFCIIFCKYAHPELVYYPEDSNYIKTGYTIRNLCWNPTNTTFAYTEGNLVLIRDAQSFSLKKSIEIENVEQIMFSQEGNAENEVLLALTKDGKLSTYNISQSTQPTISLDYKDINTITQDYNKQITSISFSKNSNYIALADNKNIVTLLFKLRFTNETIAYKTLEQEGTIFYIEFSPNTWYFATASKDNTIKIYSTDVNTNLKSITTIPFYSNTNSSFCFTQDSKKIICSTKENEISIFNLKGEKQFSIKTQNRILSISAMKDGSMISVQNDKNQLELYNIDTHEYVGYIPSYSSAHLTAYAFNNDNTFILLGYDDGSIYRLDVAKVFLEPNQVPNDIKVLTGKNLPIDTEIQDLQDGQNGQSGQGTQENAKIVGLYESNALKFYKQNKNVILPKISLGFLSNPFLLNPAVGVEYRNSKLISPGFFGGGLEVSCGLPRKNFPFTYMIGDEVQPNPIILGGKVYGTMGIIFSPWRGEFYVVTGLELGLGIYSLGYFPRGGYLITNPHLGFSTAIQLGGFYKNFQFTFAINYDTVNKFYTDLSVGYQINIKEKEKKEDEKKL